MDRISKLSERLSSIQTGLASERSSRFEQLSGNLGRLDERLGVSQEAAAKKFSLLKDQVGELGRELEGERAERNRLVETRGRELEQVRGMEYWLGFPF